MKTEWKLFAYGAVYIFLAAVAYAVWSWYDPTGLDLAGLTALVLCGGLASLIAFYVYLTSRRVGERPEDRLEAEVDEVAGELGFFSPYSYWPLWVGASAAIVTMGLVFGVWLILLGAVLLMLAVIGLVFEYYRGEHAH